MLFTTVCSFYFISWEKISFSLNKRSEIKKFFSQQTVGNKGSLFPTVCWERKKFWRMKFSVLLCLSMLKNVFKLQLRTISVHFSSVLTQLNTYSWDRVVFLSDPCLGYHWGPVHLECSWVIVRFDCVKNGLKLKETSDPAFLLPLLLGWHAPVSAPTPERFDLRPTTPWKVHYRNFE